MARRAAGATAAQAAGEHERVIDWYRTELAKPARLPWEAMPWEPVCIGPTWKVDRRGRWILPKHSIGWDVLGWAGTDLQHGHERPWRYTLEQTRFLLWWFALDDVGRWLYRDGVLQRLKGWGKDPIGATFCATELVGPCRFVGWDRGQPLASDEPDAWIQTAAVSLEQTKNTMRLFPQMFTPAAKAHYGIQVGKELVHAGGDTRLIQAVTSAPTTLEGARSTFVLQNETQHWGASNAGHEMDAVVERNSTKTGARRLKITNAYEPSTDSVAQHDREAWEQAEAGLSLTTGILYDSLEAPPAAPLTAEAAADVIVCVRGDSVWLDPQNIVASILDTRNPPSRSRRFWYNQIVADEDAWLDPKEIDLTIAERPIAGGDELALFFDGSKSDDSTGLMGCRLTDGHLVTLGIWQKPHGALGETWVVDRAAVDMTVREVFLTNNVVAFWGDPSHAKDDDETGFWDDLIDGWHRDFSKVLRLWATATGAHQHSVMWDMSSAERTKAFTLAAERFVAELTGSAAAAIEGRPDDMVLTHDGHPALRQHLRNARRYPNRWGVSLWKGHRESPKKVDLAVCAVGARMLRHLVLNKGPGDTKKAGQVWGYR